MKVNLLLVFLLLGFNSKSQLLSVNIYPSITLTESDTVKVFMELISPGGNSKRSSELEFSNDTILYSACYLYTNTQSGAITHDTAIIAPLSPGTYHFIIARHYVWFDHLCDSLQDGVTRTTDTLLVVSKATSISTANDNTLQAALINANSLQVQAAQSGISKVEVLDATGRLCYSTKREVNTGKNIIDLDMPSQSTGMYFYHISIGEQRAVLKFVKQ